MTCQEFWNEMSEVGSATTLHPHALECATCAALLERQRLLAGGLARLAQDSRRQEAPYRVEMRLREAFRQHAGLVATARPRAFEWMTWVSVAAAVAALAFFLVRGRQAERSQPRHSDGVQVAVETPGEESDFLPIPSSGGTVSTDEADLVTMEVPRATLVALGVPVAVDEPGGPIRAVFALGADGVVQGVRLLQ